MSTDDSAVSTASSGRSDSFSVVLRVGLIAGTLDITDALVYSWLRGATPKMVFQYIASGLIGATSFSSGSASVTLGICLHYLIAFTWTGVFVWAARRVRVLTRFPVASGLIYGGFVYVFMNFVVLPLSRVSHVRRPVNLASRINGVLAVVLLIGLAISLLVRRASRAPMQPT